MTNIKIFTGVIFLFFFVACVPMTKEAAFPDMYAEKPCSILVLPPINQSTAADARDYYATTLAEDISNVGFYVFPIDIVTDILRNEGLPDTELMVNLPPKKFKEYFGADAVLFTTITNWDTSYFIVGGNVTVSLEYVLKSTDSGKTIWSYSDTLKVDTTGENRAGGLGGLLLQLAETALNTAGTDYVPIAHKVNKMALMTIPAGKYHDQFGKDQKAQVVNKKKQEKAAQNL